MNFDSNNQSQVDNIIRLYLKFLNANISSVKIILTDEDESNEMLSDWLQANWEILVEAQLLKHSAKEHLAVYGDGAECNGGSSRVWLPDVMATHEIYCKGVSGKVKDLLSGELIQPESASFHSFVRWNSEEGRYSDETPFDCVFLEDESQSYILPLDSIKFAIRLI